MLICSSFISFFFYLLYFTRNDSNKYNLSEVTVLYYNLNRQKTTYTLNDGHDIDITHRNVTRINMLSSTNQFCHHNFVEI